MSDQSVPTTATAKEDDSNYPCLQDGPCEHSHCYGCGVLMGGRHWYHGWPDPATRSSLCRYVAQRDPETGAFLRWVTAEKSCWERRATISNFKREDPNGGQCCKQCGKPMNRASDDQLCGSQCRRNWRSTNDLEFQAHRENLRRARRKAKVPDREFSLALVLTA